ncbi:MAG: ATP-binding protein [Pyrinomonadaceae bacterium]
MVGQLAAGVAHEINNPLAAIVTCAETMLLDLSESPEFQGLANEREWFFYLEEIIRQALRGKGITRGLLDLSRQKSAELRSCDINQIVAQCAKLYQHRVVEKVFIATHLDPHLAPVVSDETMLRQILENLVSNALDALRSEGSVTITTSLIGGRVCIEVADTGEGIPADLLPRIFEPFYTTKDVGRGFGPRARHLSSAR